MHPFHLRFGCEPPSGDIAEALAIRVRESWFAPSLEGRAFALALPGHRKLQDAGFCH
jgi:hypothetical protein